MEELSESSTIESVRLDHHGLVASICSSLGLKDKINSRISQTDSRRVVSCGTSVVAMILNGLGFTNHRLYLTSQFFENKPVSQLLEESLSAKDLTDDTLGHALDEIAEYGATELFSEVAFEIAIEQDLLGGFHHLDTTSLSVHGNYEGYEDVESVKITHGYSKDHRPDLKQVVLSLVTHGPSDIPLWMEPLDGNSSDKESFQNRRRTRRSKGWNPLRSNWM
jgi:transposase